jgi:hypothetical protein
VESDYKIKFVKRGGSSVATIAASECAARKAGSPLPPTEVHDRRADLELPQQVDVTYIDASLWYAQGAQYARRLIGNTFDAKSVELPISLSATKAKAVADVLLHNAWKERDSRTLQVTRKYLKVDPCDVITFTDAAGESHPLRVVKAEYAFPNLVTLECVDEDTTVYAFTAPAAAPISTSTGIQIANLPILYLMDIPMIDDADDDAGVYFAGGGTIGAWRMADLSQSVDGGTVYADVDDLTSPSTTGTAVNVLADPSHWPTWDHTSYLDVQLSVGAFMQATGLAVCNWANLLLVGDELIQFRDVLRLGGNVYRLTTLLRGRRGTEWACGTHVQGERVVLIDGTTQRLALTTADIADVDYYKLVPMGVDAAVCPAVKLVSTAAALKPYAVGHVASSRDGSNNLTITWIRRTRVGGEWEDLIDVPLSETSEAYEVDVYEAGIVVRTISVVAQTASYTAAQQVTDFGSAQSEILVKIYQLSVEVGRGFATTATV